MDEFLDLMTNLYINLEIVIELMHKYARGGVEIIYEHFKDSVGDESETLIKMIELLDDITG